MKRVVLIIICICLLILDNTILPYYSYNSIFPNLLFIFAIGFSIVNGKNEAVAMGVVSGLLQDLYFFHGFGVNMLINMLLCYMAAKIGESIYKENRIIPVITCLIISIVKVLAVTVLLKVFAINVHFNSAFISSILNALVMIFVYKLILRYSKKYFIKDTWRFR